MSFSIVLLTSPKPLFDEIDTLEDIYKAGLKNIHIRKENFTEQQYINFLNGIKKFMRPNVTIHEHIGIAEQYKLKACHFKSTQTLPESSQVSLGQSVHSLEEIENSDADYFYLSPVFDSISKEGYSSNFSEEELSSWMKNKKGNKKVFALGGIDLENAQKAKDIGFDGCVVLGYIWKEIHTFKMLKKVEELLKIEQ